MYILLSSEYLRGNAGIKYLYLNTTNGSIFTYEDRTEQLPYFYTTWSEAEMLADPHMADEGYVKQGKWNNTRVVSTELVTKHDKMIGRDVEITKVSVHPKYLMNVRYNKYRSLFQILPDESIFGGSEKYIDQFTRERGHIMGMTYEIDLDGFKAVIPEDMPHHESFDNYPNEMIEWMKPRLFAPIPKLAHLILSLDIEVDIPQRRKPDVFQVEFMVSSIALVSKKMKRGYYMNDSVRGTEAEKFSKYDFSDSEIFGYDSEKEMLDDAITYIIESEYPIVVGFYSDGFDFPYLLTRAEVFGLTYSKMWGRTERMFNTVTQQHETKVIKGITGKWILDLHTFMTNPSIKNYAFAGKYDQNSLEDIAQGLLGYGKYEHDKWFSDMSSAELMYYNIKDTELVIDLFEYNNEIILQLMIMLMRLGGLTIESVCRRMISATIKGFFERLMANANILFPNRSQLMAVGSVQSVSSTGKSFKGALTIDPSPVAEGGKGTRGIHFNVWAVDYQSLYPSLIKDRNICFSTVNCGHIACKDNIVPELTHYICKLKRGFYPDAIGFIRDARVYYFKPEKKNNPEFSVIEQALKVLINASYGVASSMMFDYYCPPIGEIVTAYGRHDITEVFNKVEEDGKEILYADTDSAFIGNTDKDYIDNLIGWVRDNVGLELGVDYVANFMGLYRSKNYFMDIDGKFMVKGMTGKKKHTPPIIKEAFQHVLDVTKGMRKETYEETRRKILKVILTYRDYIEKGEFDSADVFKVTNTITKAPTQYDRPTPASRAGMMMANQMNSELERKVAIAKLVPAGSIIEYIYVNSSYKLDGGTTVIRPLQMTTPNMIYRGKYLDMMMSTLSQVTECFAITQDEIRGQSSLDEWF